MAMAAEVGKVRRPVVGHLSAFGQRGATPSIRRQPPADPVSRLLVAARQLQHGEIGARTPDQLHPHRQPRVVEADRHADHRQPASVHGTTVSIQRW